jgi:hypothetical protein
MEADIALQQDEEDEYADMPMLVHMGVGALHAEYSEQDVPLLFMLSEQNPFLAMIHFDDAHAAEEQRKVEALDLALALLHIADLQSEPEELAVSDDDTDYITGEPLAKGQHGFVLDDCRNAPLLRESLRQLLEVHHRFCNPMTNQPILAVHKVLFI